jgi:hypothetical protein
MEFASTWALDTIHTDLTTMILGATVTIIMRTDIDGTARTIGIITIGIDVAGSRQEGRSHIRFFSGHRSDAQHETYVVPETVRAIRLLGTAKRRTSLPEGTSGWVRVWIANDWTVRRIEGRKNGVVTLHETVQNGNQDPRFSGLD